MTRRNNHIQLALIRNIRTRVALAIFIMLGVFLFTSEIINSMFNNRLDSLGFTFAQRLAFSFKPTVVGIYLIFSTGMYFTVMHFLKPLFQCLKTGENYNKARNAASAIPFLIIIFQIISWTVGTVAYYMINGWEAESGIPFALGFFSKMGVGFPAAVFTSIIFNLIMIPAKQSLNITNVLDHEDDSFSRQRDYYAIGAVLLLVISNYTYLNYYFANSSNGIALASFYGPLAGIALFYAVVSFGLISLSKRDYTIQVHSISSVLKDLASGHTAVQQRLHIINFNELGFLSGHVNKILDNFTDLLNEIKIISAQLSDSSQRLASSGQENAAYSNQQAASATEIVATMEELHKLSAEIGQQVREVETVAKTVKEGVYNGFQITQENSSKMQEVTESYSGTIDGMRNLGDHINGIWEIVKIINGIAGQIKIIAFNAALEASSAGEAGRNFEIVASEIRRLADNTVSSTNEIRNKISDIQHASDELVSSSEADTLKIQDAWNMSSQLETVFKEILASSENSANAAARMSSSVAQQIQAFDQVLHTSRQISSGIHEFAGSIEETSLAANTMESTVDTLNEIVGSSEKQRNSNE